MIHAPDFRLLQQLCQAAALLLVAAFVNACRRHEPAAKPVRIRVENETRTGLKRDE